MKRRIQLLAALLCTQLLLALGLGLSGTAFTRAAGATAPLLHFDRGAIDRITLEGPDQAKVLLEKKDGNWQLPGAEGFPADAALVAQLLDRLAGLRGGDVVATSADARGRFRVGDDAFERRITLANGDKPQATLYLGTSPALRRLHARTQGSDDVHIVELAVFDVPVKAGEWEDKSLLEVPQADIAAITLDGLRIERPTATQTGGKPGEAAAPAWVASSNEAGRKLKLAAADTLAQQLAQLSFDKVLGKAAQPGYGLEQPVLALTLTRKDGESIDYKLGKPAGKDEYTLKVSTRPEYFRLAGWTANALVHAADRATLLEAVPAQAAAAAANEVSPAPAPGPAPRQTAPAGPVPRNTAPAQGSG